MNNQKQLKSGTLLIALAKKDLSTYGYTIALQDSFFKIIKDATVKMKKQLENISKK
ncbi:MULTISPECIES: hypothetical protein [Photorhabdus]|uniref:hypothetical protein n=1 Tax=Photorhabdus TaxID=29487 RepID=UPI00128F20B9|nr:MULTISPECIES: hypothetical protein [Photorhabdus]